MKPLSEMRARLAEVGDEMDAFVIENEDDETRFADLEAEADNLMADIEKVEARNARRDAIKAKVESGEAKVESGTTAPVVGVRNVDPFDPTEIRHANPSEMRARAYSAIEEVRGVSDDAKAEMTRKVDTVKGPVAELILRTSSDAYRSAWAKAMAGRENTWTPEESAAVERTESFRAAFGLTQSGYAAPAVVDPSVILTSAGSTNPVRVLARVESIMSNSWKPVTSGGVTASWDGEMAEVSDDTPTFAQPEITAYKAQAFAQGSIEGFEDWAAIGAELGREFADAKDQLEAVAHISGSGSSQPVGITTALDGTASEIAPASAETFAVADVYATVKAVPPRFRGPNSRVATLGNLGTINAIRQFATANNYHAFLTDMADGSPSRLLGYPLYEASAMDDYDDLNPAVTADNFLLVAGDWSKYVIVDRIGLSVEFVPHLFNTANNLPDGRRGWYCHWRTGADSIVDGAFAMLSIPTTL